MSDIILNFRVCLALLREQVDVWGVGSEIEEAFREHLTISVSRVV